MPIICLTEWLLMVAISGDLFKRIVYRFKFESYNLDIIGRLHA